MSEYRKGLPERPPRVALLPLDERGYPIPWFVCTLPSGERDFRITDQAKRVRALKFRLCWICGQPLGRFMSFVIGPMCAVNRNTSEPPAHLDCARYAVQACPFMVLPKSQYRPVKGVETSSSTNALPGNPGAAAIWTTDEFQPYRVPGDPVGFLIRVGEPSAVEWWSEGKLASRERIMECLKARLPLLESIAAEEGEASQAALSGLVSRALTYLPAEAS